jgi:LacI family transcriptional regulator
MLPKDLSPPAPRSTIRDVAAEAGVSTATVSRVINDSASVAPETRAMVLKAIERHSFIARRRRLSGNHLQNVVAVRCPYVLTDYFGAVVSAIARSLRQHGKRLLLSAEANESDAAGLPELLLSEATEGAVLVLPPEPSSVLADLRARDYPFVVVDPRTRLSPDIAAVSAAHMAGSRTATEHLLRLGHSRIAIIAGPVDWLAGEGRLVGYRAALAAVGRLAPDQLVRFGGEPTIANGLEAARALLALPEPPTAIVAFNDKMAIGALQAAAERKLRVPRDLSIVGFDALELSTVVVPPLTTVRQPLDEMGRMGVELLIRLIEGREIHTLHVELATELVAGASTAPPR